MKKKTTKTVKKKVSAKAKTVSKKTAAKKTAAKKTVAKRNTTVKAKTAKKSTEKRSAEAEQQFRQMQELVAANKILQNALLEKEEAHSVQVQALQNELTHMKDVSAQLENGLADTIAKLNTANDEKETARMLHEQEMNRIKSLMERVAEMAEAKEREISLLRGAPSRLEAIVNQLLSKVQPLQEEVEKLKWYLGEERADKERLNASLDESTAHIGRLDEEINNLRAKAEYMQKQYDEAKWHCGEEQAARENAERAVDGAQEYIAQQAADIDALRSEIDARGRQFDESQWYLGEAKARVKALENELGAQEKYAQVLSDKIEQLQEALAETTMLAGEWMSRWDELIKTARRFDEQINIASLESGEVFEKQLSCDLEELESLKQACVQAEKLVREKEEELEEAASQNRGLQRRIEELEKNYSESQWYLGEAKYQLEQMMSATETV